MRKDTILSGIFAAAKFHKRAKSNKYEENTNLPQVVSGILTKHFLLNAIKFTVNFY